jgi:hypothetical protein
VVTSWVPATFRKQRAQRIPLRRGVTENDPAAVVITSASIFAKPPEFGCPSARRPTHAAGTRPSATGAYSDRPPAPHWRTSTLPKLPRNSSGGDCRECTSRSTMGYGFPTEPHTTAGLSSTTPVVRSSSPISTCSWARVSYASKSSFPSSARFGSPASSSASHQAIRMDSKRNSSQEEPAICGGAALILLPLGPHGRRIAERGAEQRVAADVSQPRSATRLNPSVRLYLDTYNVIVGGVSPATVSPDGRSSMLVPGT